MADSKQPYTLVVIDGVRVQSFPLPESGRITFGRSTDCDVPLDDLVVSREHAALHVGAALEVEDLNSANGTRLGGKRLGQGRRTPIIPGQVIELGSTLVVVQRRPKPPAPPSPAPYAVVEEEVSAACRRGEPIALLRVRVEGTASSSAVREALVTSSPGTTIAAYAPGDYLMVFDPTVLEATQKRLNATLTLLDCTPRMGVAISGIDGDLPHELLAFVSRAVVGGEPLAIEDIVADDAAMKDLFRLAGKVASGSINVLIAGEAGSGKKVLASGIHRHSARRNMVYKGVDCRTARVADLHAAINAAQDGTLLLSRVELLSTELQRELTSVLFGKTGQVRCVSTIQGDPHQAIVRGDLAADLHALVSGVTLVTPPLRARKSDIVALSRLFVRRQRRHLGLVGDIPFDRRTLVLLRDHDWPENITELRNVVERAAIVATEGRIGPEHLSVDRLTARWGVTVALPNTGISEAVVQDGDERQRIVLALERCGGNQTRAARELGISRRTLTTRLSRYGIPRPRKGG